MRRKSIIVFSLVLFAALFLLRHQIVVVGTKVCLNKTFDQNVAFKDVKTRKGKVVVQGLAVRDKQMLLVVEEMEFGLSFGKVITHPKGFISLCRKGISSWEQALFAMKRYGNGLQIQNGVLQLDDHRYYFKFDNETLAITHDPSLKDHPFLEANFHVKKDQVSVLLDVKSVPSQRLLKLAAFAFPEYLSDLQEAQGQVELKASAQFNKKGELADLSTRFACENFQLFYPKLEIAAHAKKWIGALNYPKGDAHLPLWKRMECKTALEKGTLIWGEKLSLANLNGNLCLDPKLDPSLVLKGDLADEGKPLHLKLEGKGAVHEDNAYWLEFALSLDNRLGTECGAFLSICRPQADDLVVQLEASNLLPSQVEMLRGYFAKSIPRLNEWEVKEGSVGGKLVALFEKGQLASFEVNHLVGEDIVLGSTTKKDPLYFARIRGEGRLFDAFNLEIEIPAPDLFSFVSPEFKEAYANYRYDEMAKLALSMKFGKKMVETSAHVEFTQQKQSVQFGYKSKSPFPASLAEISEGWVHSDHLTHMLYGPFVKLACEDLQLFGTIDLTATYDGKQLDCTLQIDQPLARHPLLDFKSAAIGEKGKVQGRAKITYNLAAGTFTGTIPLQKAEAYDRTSGILFRDLTTDLILETGAVKGHVAHADISYDTIDLLQNAQFDFSFEEKLSISSFNGKIALPGSAEFFISGGKLDSRSCDFTLLQGKDVLARFSGSKGDLWSGTLAVKPIGQDFDLQFAYDPRTESALLDAKGSGIHLFCKKQGADILLEKLDFKDFSIKGVLAKAEKGFTLTDFQLEQPNLTLRGSGTVAVDLPQAESNFGLRSELALSVEMEAPLPLQLKTTRTFKAVYSPGLGLILSDLDFAAAGCQLNIGQFEYLKGGDHQAASQCSFKFSEEMLARFCAAGALPSFLRDFKIFKTLEGQVNYSQIKGKTTIEGTLSNKAISLEWKDQAGEFSFGNENERLLFQVHKDEEGFHLDGIKGSIGKISADLKKQGKEQLKGQVSLDFSSLGELFDLPLNRFTSLWKAGGGYQFEGSFTPKKELSDWTFKGKLTGRDFEWSGYQIDSLHAKLEMEPGKITIENLDLSDDAGKVWIGEASISRSKNKQWVFSVPKAEIRNFTPSLMTKMDAEAAAAKSLVAKSITLENLKGRIDDLKSITGSGKLNFTNMPKKGEKHQIAKLPAQLLEKLKLDSSLFVPTSGEVQVALENGKCFLKEVQTLMTEKKKSEFEAHRNGSMGYIDFDGNFFINLQVKQHVVRGLTTPLTLQVRGKWDDPELIIK